MYRNKFISTANAICGTKAGTEIFLIPFYLQAVQIHSANGGKLREA
jgi:hypothetical protein